VGLSQEPSALGSKINPELSTGSEDLVGFEGLGILIVPIDEGPDIGFELSDGSLLRVRATVRAPPKVAQSN